MSQFTQILERVQPGDPKAVADLLPIGYEELRRRAPQKRARAAAGRTLQPTVSSAFRLPGLWQILRPAGGEWWSISSHGPIAIMKPPPNRRACWCELERTANARWAVW